VRIEGKLDLMNRGANVQNVFIFFNRNKKFNDCVFFASNGPAVKRK